MWYVLNRRLLYHCLFNGELVVYKAKPHIVDPKVDRISKRLIGYQIKLFGLHVDVTIELADDLNSQTSIDDLSPVVILRVKRLKGSGKMGDLLVAQLHEIKDAI